MEFIGGMSWAPYPTKRTVGDAIPYKSGGDTPPLHFTSSLFTLHYSLYGMSWAPSPTKRTVGDACPYIFPFSSGVRAISLGITPHPSTALTPSPTGEGKGKKETTNG